MIRKTSNKIDSSQKNTVRDTSLGQAKMLSSQGKSLIAIDERWRYFFIGDPIFEAIIKDGRIILRGPKVSPRSTVPTAVTGGDY